MGREGGRSRGRGRGLGGAKAPLLGCRWQRFWGPLALSGCVEAAVGAAQRVSVSVS